MAEERDLKEKTSGEHIEVLEKPAAAATGNALLIDDSGQVRKLPIPSSNPNDPLNFSYWKKAGVIVACCWFGRHNFY